MCAKYDIPHIVNNAYGVQSSKCMHLIQQVVTGHLEPDQSSVFLFHVIIHIVLTDHSGISCWKDRRLCTEPGQELHGSSRWRHNRRL